MKNEKLKMGLVFVIGFLSGAAWLFGSVLPAFYLDAALYTNDGPMLNLGLTVLLFSALFGAAGALLTVLAGRRLPVAPYIHLLASVAFVLFTGGYIDGLAALIQVLFEPKFWTFMFGAALVFLVARRQRAFQPALLSNVRQ